MSGKVKGKIKFSVGQAFKVLVCAIFRVEMDLEITTDDIRFKRDKTLEELEAEAYCPHGFLVGCPVCTRG